MYMFTLKKIVLGPYTPVNSLYLSRAQAFDETRKLGDEVIEETDSFDYCIRNLNS